MQTLIPLTLPRNCKNIDLAYEYLNYRISPELQTKTGKALNEAPTNTEVDLMKKKQKI